MLETVGMYWEYAILLPLGYIVKMVITNNKSIQDLKQELARDFVTETELEKHEQRMKEYIHTFKDDIARIDKKLDHMLIHLKRDR